MVGMAEGQRAPDDESIRLKRFWMVLRNKKLLDTFSAN
jgi:hypothetical protein